MKILLVKTSSLGDVVHNLPVASDIRTRFPGAAIDWVVEEGFAEIPRLHPAVRRVIPVAVRRWRHNLLSAATWRELRAYRDTVRAETYDLVLDTQGLVKSALLARKARGKRVGHAVASAREPLAARFYDVTYSIPKDLHAVERNRRLAAAALDFAPGLPLDYGIAAAPLAAPWLPAAPYSVLLTASSRVDKLWPEAGWLRLGAALNARGLACVLPGGSAAERDRAARLAEGMATAVVAPPMGIGELAQLLAGARLVVGVDTGLSHLAAALSRPTVCLFAGSRPELTGVHAGESALNLGGAGQPPTAEDVTAAVDGLIGRMPAAAEP
ncbi:MAG TPA: lipopolysaccharide heptosyltransferase I [Candidatus Desulfobacillus sp.]|mgnify:CR=1 FL=1|nr:lipopolysaccharide heptosyltransferase I [Candidatus Desulfobacillus sp.]